MARLRILVAVALLGAGGALAQTPPGDSSFEIYGFIMADVIQDMGGRVAPDWKDALRPSRIGIDGEYGPDGETSLSAKQSRFGLNAGFPTSLGLLKTKFEFDLFGVGDDAGQTTIRVRHLWGELGKWGAGQTNSVFMDGDTFPNVVEYWGPCGMVFYRNVQVRYTPIQGDTEVAIAIERPGSDIDKGEQLDPDLADSISSHNDLPDFTARGRLARDWGHVQLAGILRKVGYQGINPETDQPIDDSKTGWGLNLSSNIKLLKKDVAHLSVVWGEGISSYMNDGGTDLAPEFEGETPRAKAVPLLGLMAYYDHYWNDRFSSSIGYSETSVDNTSGQAADAFATGRYASANLLYTPAENFLVGGELIWGEKEIKDGRSDDVLRLQVSFKYDFGRVF